MFFTDISPLPRYTNAITKGGNYMDIQHLLAEAQAKADSNNDGKLSIDDLKALLNEHGLDSQLLDSLKAKVDTNDDGRLSIDDLSTALSNASQHLGNTLHDTKDNAGNFIDDAQHHVGNVVDTVKDTLFGDTHR